MFTHRQIWAAIDAMAQAQGLTVSGLAMSAGLDATAFNRSKRAGLNGRPRWPSTETLARILKVTNMDLRALADVIDAIPEEGAGEAQPPGLERKEKNRRRG